MGLPRQAALLALLLLAPLSLQSQRLDPEPFNPIKYPNQLAHVAAGAGLTLTLQLPLGRWRDSWWKRGLIITALGVAFEAGQMDVANSSGLSGNGYGFGLADLASNTVGWIGTELLLYARKKRSQKD